MKMKNKFRQYLVHWPGDTNDGYGGFTYNTPTEHLCRWQEETVTFIDFAGNQAVSKAVIYLPETLARRGAWVYEGRETELDSDHSDPTEITGVFPIKGVSNSPTLRNRQKFYKVFI